MLTIDGGTGVFQIVEAFDAAFALADKRPRDDAPAPRRALAPAQGFLPIPPYAGTTADVEPV